MITNIEELYHRFQQVMSPEKWWATENKWEILLGAVLVQNTNWKNVDYSLLNLARETAFDPRKIVALKEETLQELIRPSGFYKNKAKTIHALFAWAQETQFDLQTISLKEQSALREELLSIKGVGPETADVLLVYVFGKSTFIADRYAQRLFEKWGVSTSNYNQLKARVLWPKQLDTKAAQDLHGWIVAYGQRYLKNDDIWKEGPLKDFTVQFLTS